ncbi:MAG: prolyl oligopeptidase family serine peptidase [Gemmataceae bacterium]|nr:prolyl oligopeptidase family serine peptidase [Gemmataceae bacterium]
MRGKTWLTMFVLGALMAATTRGGGGPLQYPPTKRTDHVDTLHGVKVPDPYRWLEQDVRTSKEVADWVEVQSKFTEKYLAKLPERDFLKRRLTELWNYEKYSAPFKAGQRYFFSRNDGLQNQSVLYTVDALDGKPRALIDPNKWSKDGTVALSGLSASDDGQYLAYGKSSSGSDWVTWHVLEVSSGKTLDDELKWTKFAGAEWTRDGKGFFYSRYEEPKKGEAFQGLVFKPKLCYHRVGTPQADDVVVYYRPDFPEWGFATDVSEDGRYHIITVWKGTDRRYRVTYRDLSDKNSMPVDLIKNFDHNYTFVGNDGPVFYFKTDHKAPRGRVIAIDSRKPEPANWKEIIPQAKENLTGVSMVGDQFTATYLKDARTQVKVYTVAGRFLREVDLPGLGSAGGFGGKRSDTETFYSFSSFATPPSIYRYDTRSGQSTLWKRAEVKLNPDDYEVKQVFYQSKDGTKVPMFITHRKGIKLDGTNPVLLYGYGGFNISLTPAFAVSKLLWMEMGGVYAQPNIRGGGEYGKEWHQAAVKLKRQKAYDDFMAAAEWLIANKYTKAEKLAIQGGSNGGLLVGACMTQRPELFGACLPAVGVMDMLRFHKFTAGRYWVDDYGSPDDPEQFKVLVGYSPYHNLKKGTRYPATLVTTADTDDRVVPSHSFKFIAQLQHCHEGNAPVLARIETRAGHGAGRPTSKAIEEVADQYAFLVKNLNMKLPTR